MLLWIDSRTWNDHERRVNHVAMQVQTILTKLENIMATLSDLADAVATRSVEELLSSSCRSLGGSLPPLPSLAEHLLCPAGPV